MEQEEYTKEEIDWSYIEFVDNQDILDLIEKVCVLFFCSWIIFIILVPKILLYIMRCYYIIYITETFALGNFEKGHDHIFGLYFGYNFE